LSLEARLRERIQRDGPINFYEWMKSALYDEREGYYCTPRVRQGRAGDYRTAPETSPLFGAVFARYFMKAYFDLAAPDEFVIIEVGAGRGDCAHAVLTTLQRNFPKVFAATRYFIAEISDNARSQALTKLAEFNDQIEFRSLAEIERRIPHAIIFSNELFDAFPVNRVIGRNGKLRELYVGISDGNFVWVENDLSPRVAEYCSRVQLELADGQVYEVNLGVEEFISRAAEIMRRGLVISVDYGAERNDLLNDQSRFGGTLRAFHRHQFIENLLSHPGEYDLTTTVDWAQIIEAGRRNGFEALRLQRLDEFLWAEGAADVLGDATTQILDPVESLSFTTRARELIVPNGMAASFQVLVQSKQF
jgi:SAM-dependent MidA family methyltransferase